MCQRVKRFVKTILTLLITVIDTKETFPGTPILAHNLRVFQIHLILFIYICEFKIIFISIFQIDNHENPIRKDKLVLPDSCLSDEAV